MSQAERKRRREAAGQEQQRRGGEATREEEQGGGIRLRPCNTWNMLEMMETDRSSTSFSIDASPFFFSLV